MAKRAEGSQEDHLFGLGGHRGVRMLHAVWAQQRLHNLVHIAGVVFEQLHQQLDVVETHVDQPLQWALLRLALAFRPRPRAAVGRGIFGARLPGMALALPTPLLLLVHALGLLDPRLELPLGRLARRFVVALVVLVEPRRPARLIPRRRGRRGAAVARRAGSPPVLAEAPAPTHAAMLPPTFTPTFGAMLALAFALALAPTVVEAERGHGMECVR
mmetsp:Transcript_22589/g.65126  ORF Transcript_22589/g.65126 Transcript_22589/m.65126 type:complete len:215 (-) Transcript_22589:1119-1763(-)